MTRARVARTTPERTARSTPLCVRECRSLRGGRCVRAVLPVVAVLALLTGCSAGSAGSDGSSAGVAGSPDVVWRADTGGSDPLRSFRETPWNTQDAEDPRVSASPDASGRGALAFTVPAGGTRSELEPATRAYREGDRYFFGLGLRLPPGFPTGTSDWQVVAQWKNSGEGSPPLSVKVGRGRLLLDGGDGIGKRWQRDIGPAPTGRRIDLVVGVRFSSDPDGGEVDVWQDGDRVVTGYRPRGSTLYPAEVSYLKIGLYRSADIATAGTVYYDDVVVARTRDAATPRPAA